MRKTEAISQRGGKVKAVDQAAGFELDSRCAVSPCVICVVGRGRLPRAVSGQRERDVGV